MNRFTINNVNFVVSSQLAIHNDTCPICRFNLTDKCYKCSSVENSNCTSVLGVCNHGYHLHCIEDWLKTKKVCPLDNQPWNYLKHNCNVK